MPRKNIGKKINTNGALEDLGNTLSDDDLEKLDGIEKNAQKNVQSDWNATSGDAFIKNKPTLFSGNYNDLTNKPTIPTNNNQLTNGAGYITSSGSITGNAKTATTATNATKLNNQEASYYLNYNNLSNKPTIPTIPVQSVNSKTGAVVLTQDDVGDGTTYKRVTSTEKTNWNNKANSSDVVKLTGNQTVSGTKTFSDGINLGSQIKNGSMTDSIGLNGAVLDKPNLNEITYKGIYYCHQGTNVPQFDYNNSHYTLIVYDSSEYDTSGAGSSYVTQMVNVGWNWWIRARNGSTWGSWSRFAQTPNNGKLTIQKNGTQVGTFTANQSGNSTINIQAIDSNDTVYQFAQEEYNKGLNLFDANVSYRFSSYNDYISTGDGSVSLKDVGSNSTYAVSETKYTMDKFVLRATFSNNYPRYIYAPYDENDNLVTDLLFGDLKYNSVYKGYYADVPTISITKPPNVAYYKLGFVITSGTATQQIVGVSNIMLVEGSEIPSSYIPYNANKQITNNQADFLKEEYNNSKNLLDINNYVDLGGYIGFDISQLVIGETYTFSSNKPIYWFKISSDGGGYNSVAREGQHTTFTFTMARNSNIPTDRKQYLILSINSSNIYSPITSISQLSGYNLQIEKGSVATTYQSFNGGEIVHKGDVTPTLLYFGAANANLTLADYVENYDYIEIFYDVSNSEGQNSIKVSAEKLLIGDITIFGTTIDASAFPNNFGLINYYKRLTIRGKNLNINAYGRWWRYKNDSNSVTDSNNDIWIHTILGYKEV